jgi:hypothetical protein
VDEGGVIVKPVISDMRADLYHADTLGTRQPSLSKSVAHILLNHSPLHAWTAHPKLNPDFEPTVDEKYDIGTAVHGLFLEGQASVAVIPYDDWRTKAAAEARKEARAAGLTPLLAKQWDDVRRMEQAIWEQLDRHTADPPLFQAGLPERTVVWEDQGVLCRARLDWLHNDFAAIDDLKTTTRSANPEQWARMSMFSIGADIQAAFYARGVKAATGVEPTFRLVIAECSSPYAISVVSPGPDVLALAEKKVDWALALWRRCLADNRWPGYEDRVAYAELPPWEESRWLEREMREVAA